MTDAELDRCKTLLLSIEAAKPTTTVYDPARETLRWMVEDEERKRRGETKQKRIETKQKRIETKHDRILYDSRNHENLDGAHRLRLAPLFLRPPLRSFFL